MYAVTLQVFVRTIPITSEPLFETLGKHESGVTTFAVEPPLDPPLPDPLPTVIVVAAVRPPPLKLIVQLPAPSGVTVYVTGNDPPGLVIFAIEVHPEKFVATEPPKLPAFKETVCAGLDVDANVSDVGEVVRYGLEFPELPVLPEPPEPPEDG